MPEERITIMGIPFDKVTLDQALSLLLKKLEDNSTKGFFVATPNPEMLLEAQKNAPFKKILQNTGLNIPDGTGIIWASIINHTPLPERVTGTDLMENLCTKILPDTGVFLLGGAGKVAEKVKTTLEASRKISIVGTHSGSAAPSDDLNIRKIINAAKPDLLFVAYGAPKQELWLARNLPHLPSVKVAIGVGGAFDFIAGEKKRAPVWMRKTGLEWLYRVIRQPGRINRIFNATIRFPILFMYEKKGSNFRFLDPGVLREKELELDLIKQTPANPAKGYFPMYVFKMNNCKTGENMGEIRLRVGYNENIKYGGHIGYEVKEAFRGHRYASRSVKLLLPLAKKHGINPLWITCNPNNNASRKTCELAGGKLTEIANLPEHNEQYLAGDRQKCRYKFDL